MRYEIRPISDPTRFSGKPRTQDQFKASFEDTVERLCYEVARLDGKDLVLEIDVYPGDIKINGELKQYARPTQPGVCVAFESKHGPLVYACDRFHDWRANVRGIALGLEALRAVDRYGISSRGEQYTGYAQIEAGPSGSSHMTRRAAAELLERFAIGEEDGPTRTRMIERLLSNRDEVVATLRHARAVAHPDRRDGDRTLWDQVEQAARVLGVLS